MNTNVLEVLATLCLVVVLFPPTQAQRPAFGKCPQHPTVGNFDADRFDGAWYEVERSFYVFEITSTCTSFNFTSSPDGTLRVVIKTISRLTRNPSVHLGTAYPERNNRAKFRYRVDSYLPAPLSRMLPSAGEYLILDTDYEDYAILWSCSDLGFFHADLIWVLGRERDLSVDTRSKVYNTLNNLGFDPDILVITKHRMCPEF